MRNLSLLYLVVIPVMVFIVVGCTVSRDSNPLLENDVRVFILTNAEKLRRDQEPEYTNKRKLTTSLAKNEQEGLQFVVNSNNEIKNLKIEVSELISGENRIGSEAISVYREHYIDVYLQPVPAVKPGFYPDALIPMKYDDLNLCDVTPGNNQGYWINIKTTAQTAAGIYTGTVTLTHDSGIIKLPVEVEVWNFTLPVENSFKTCFGLTSSAIWNQYKKYGADTSSNYQTEINKYMEMLLDHRVNPSDLGQPMWSSPEALVDYIADIVKDPRINTVQIPYRYDGYKDGKIIHNDNNAYNIKVCQLMEEKSLTEYGYYYVIDEPSLTEENAKEVRAICSDIKSFSKIPIMVTTGPNTALFGGYMGIWCPLVNRVYMNNADIEQLAADRRSEGEEVWWYTCVSPRNPAPTYHIDDRLMSSRLLSWMQKDYQITGNLYWTTTVYECYRSRDIWTETYIEPQNTAAGDGILIYPGVVGDGVINRNTPVPSMRLESVRDGEKTLNI